MPQRCAAVRNLAQGFELSFRKIKNKADCPRRLSVATACIVSALAAILGRKAVRQIAFYDSVRIQQTHTSAPFPFQQPGGKRVYVSVESGKEKGGKG